jgi:hypothetical protein
VCYNSCPFGVRRSGVANNAVVSSCFSGRCKDFYIILNVIKFPKYRQIDDAYTIDQPLKVF